MTDRPTADIVAHLRNADIGVCEEAADRPTELDAQLAAVNAALDQYEAGVKVGADPVIRILVTCVSAVAKAVGR